LIILGISILGAERANSNLLHGNYPFLPCRETIFTIRLSVVAPWRITAVSM
jgi:hypothetical protein